MDTINIFETLKENDSTFIPQNVDITIQTFEMT